MEERLERLEKRLERLEKVVGQKFTQEQARKYLGVCRSTMMRYRKMGILTPRRDGNRLYYSITDLEKLS